jgi:hypothetical protein
LIEIKIMSENGTTSTKSKPLCFVIGPIGKAGSNERKHADLLLNSVIRPVLQAPEFGYFVKRADDDADPGMIGDRVVTDIINADLVVADLTDLNPNAFYELGIRHSTERPTIHIAKFGTDLPFDNVSHRTIFVDLTDWSSTEQARSRLTEAARAIKSPGYKVSNPITQANASFKMRQSADPKDQILTNIQDRLAALESDAPRSTSTVTDSDIVRATDELIDYARSLPGKGIALNEINRRVKLKGNQLGIKVQSVEIKGNFIHLNTDFASWMAPLEIKAGK